MFQLIISVPEQYGILITLRPYYQLAEFLPEMRQQRHAENFGNEGRE